MLSRAEITAIAALLWISSTTPTRVSGFTLSSFSNKNHQKRPCSRDASLIVLHASASPKYVRWYQTPQGWEMQTAVTTFEKKSSSSSLKYYKTNKNQACLELHAQLHFGDREYFDYYNSPSFNRERRVLYELLLDESLLQETNDRRTVKEPLSASPTDQQTAQQYGWECQVDSIRYNQENWVHADLTRQEFLARAQQDDAPLPPQSQKPLWQVAASNNPNPLMVPAAATEAATALLVGPPSLSMMMRQQQQQQSQPQSFSLWQPTQRRLFSNLFLPGDALAQVLRSLLWFTVPSPELSILLLDWSSIFLVDRGDKVLGGLSPITVPLLQALVTARFQEVRRLVFGQVVISGNQIQNKSSNPRGRSYDLLIELRNQKALQVLAQEQNADKVVGNDKHTMALLYGCSHCSDLHQKLVQDHGYQPVQTEWRTAWTVSPVPFDLQQHSQGTQSVQENAARIAAVGLLVLLPFYFAVGGLDWISTLGEIVREKDSPIEMAASSLLYLGRHVLLYVGLSKVLLNWETREEREDGDI